MSAASDLLGRTIRRCVVAEHVLDSATLVELALEFEDGTSITLTAAADGAALRLDQRAVEPADLGEAGAVVVRDLGPAFEALMPGTEIAAAVPLLDRSLVAIGVTLTNSSKREVHIYNWGDQLHIDTELPPAVLDELASE